ncbi:MAG: LysR substrate-binding domain-containing protein [Leucothrix sp.]
MDKDAITIDKLRLLAAFTSAGSSVEAAKQLSVTPAALAQSLYTIQAGLGLSLIEPAGDDLLPTSECLRIAEEGKRVLAALNRVKTLASEMQGNSLPEVSVGVMTAFIHGELARCIARYSTEYTKLSIRLESHTKQQLIQKLVDGKLDIAAAIGSVKEPGISTFATIAMRIVCVMAPDCPLAQQQVIHENDLQTYRQIRLTKGSALRIALEANGIAASQEGHGKGVIEANTQRTMVIMVEAGAGVALVDPLVLSPEDKIAVREFSPPVYVNLSLFARDDWARRPYVKGMAMALYDALSPLSSLRTLHHDSTTDTQSDQEVSQ